MFSVGIYMCVCLCVNVSVCLSVCVCAIYAHLILVKVLDITKLNTHHNLIYSTLMGMVRDIHRGGGSSFTLVRQILQAWTYMCGKQGYLQDLENLMYKCLLCKAQSAC